MPMNLTLIAALLSSLILVADCRADAAPVAGLSSATLLGALVLPQDDRDKKEIEEIRQALGGKPLTVDETPNFTWVVSMPKGKLSKISSEAEACYKIFAEQAGLTDWKDLWHDKRKCMGVVLANKSDYKRYVKWYADTYPVWNKEHFVDNHSSSQWFAVDATRNVMVTHLKPNDEDAVAAVMCHLVGHQVVNRYKFNQNFTPGWLRECLGVYFQSEVHGQVICGNYQDPYGLGSGDEDRQKGLKKAEYRKRAKKEMAAGRLRNLKTFFTYQVENQMEFEDTLKGHILISWMMKDKGKLPEFITAMKKRWPGNIVSDSTPDKEKAQAEALKEVFQVSIEECDRELGKYAKSGY